ncbi:MAG: FecCD family ABC transporter permease [Saccharofermentanales bacterium]
MEKKTNRISKRSIITLYASLALLLGVAILAIGIGSVYISPANVIRVLFSPKDTASTEYIIIFNMRLARVIASVFGGGALALSGLLLQILFNNPIADPYVLGISSGARLFVGIVLLGGVTMKSGFLSNPTGMNVLANPWFMFVGAFAGALLVMFVMLGFAAKIKNITMLLIIGIMLGYLCSSIVGILVAFSDDHNIADFTKWNMGTFGLMTWEKIYVMVIVCSVLFVLSFLLSKKLNALLLGESYAKTMGINIKALRVLIIMFSSVLTAVVTAFAGLIAFVGMSVPHIARLLLKTNDARVLLPATIILGGIFGVGCDLIARTIAAPNELAVGTITSFVGVPIILYLLIRKNSAREL